MADQKEHQFQYTEFWDQRTGLTFGIREILFSKQSDFQHVQVLETDAFGRLLTLDGLVMVTDRDEFVYHEMIAHIPMLAHPNPRRVLVIGGGPAEQAGLQKGDVIIEIAGQTIANIYDYTYALDAVKIGQAVEVLVEREGKQVKLTVTPEARK